MRVFYFELQSSITRNIVIPSDSVCVCLRTESGGGARRQDGRALFCQAHGSCGSGRDLLVWDLTSKLLVVLGHGLGPRDSGDP